MGVGVYFFMLVFRVSFTFDLIVSLAEGNVE